MDTARISRRIWRWAGTLRGIAVLCATVISAAATVYFGAFYHQPGQMTASLNFAYLSPQFIDARNSGLQLSIYNGSATTQVVTDVRVADSETYTPVPYAVQTDHAPMFRVEPRTVSATIPAGGQDVAILRTSTVASLTPYQLIVNLASGSEVSVDVDPFIYLLRCAVGAHSPIHALVVGQTTRLNQPLRPYLATQGGLVGIVVGPPPKVPAACRGKRVMHPSDPCIKSGMRQGILFPIGLDPHERWDGPFPPPPKK